MKTTNAGPSRDLFVFVSRPWKGKVEVVLLRLQMRLQVRGKVRPNQVGFGWPEYNEQEALGNNNLLSFLIINPNL
jgi:hypothetical protein